MTDTAKAASTCLAKVRVSRMRWERCPRAVKDEGLCGIHLAAKRKRAANDVKREQHWKDSQTRLETAKAATAKIPNAYPNYGVGGPDGRIVVPAAIAYEYDALKAVEAAARTVGDKYDIYVGCLLADTLEDRPSSPPTDHAHIEVSEAVDELLTALAALDAIRTPDDGKRGGARL